MTTYSLRHIQDDDHEWLVKLHNDPLVLRNVTDPTAITLESHMKWWEGIKESTTEERMIFCIDGNRAGITKFYKIDQANKSCKLGADLHVDFRGKGHAKHMWRLMIDRCYKIHNLHRIALTTAEYNEIAIYTYLSLGFKIEGRKKFSLFRDEKFYDELCMYQLDEDWKNPPKYKHKQLGKCEFCNEFFIKLGWKHKRCKTCVPNKSAYHRASHYKLSADMLKKLINEQENVCAICSNELHSESINGMHVDHDHELGHVRGLLCRSCNTSIGFVEKLINSELLEKTLRYLNDHRPRR